MRKFLRGMVTLLCALSLVGCSTGADSLAELEQLEELEEITSGGRIMRPAYKSVSKLRDYVTIDKRLD